MNDESRPWAASENPAKNSDSNTTSTGQRFRVGPLVSGRVVLDLARYADDVGFVSDAARGAMVWPDVPDGVTLLVELGDASEWNSWLFGPLSEGPLWSQVEIRGTGNVGRAVREIREILGAVR